MPCFGRAHDLGPHGAIWIYLWEQRAAEVGGLHLLHPAGGEGGVAGEEAAYRGT